MLRTGSYHRIEARSIVMNPSAQRARLPFSVIAIAMLVIGFALLLSGSFVSRSKVEADHHSEYSHIRVRRSGNVRTLVFVQENGKETVESRLDLEKPHVLRSSYARVMFASYLFQPNPQRVLIVGLGGGAMVHFLSHHEPDVAVDVVEIDPVVVRLADEFFDVRSGGNVNILTTDAFDYLQGTEQNYDVIYMDAFLKPSEDTDATGIPQRLKTIAFYESIQRKLTPGGIVVFNLNKHQETERDIDTIDSAFRQTFVFRCPNSGNLVVAALTSEADDPSEIAGRAKELDRRFDTNFSLAEIWKDRWRD